MIIQSFKHFGSFAICSGHSPDSGSLHHPNVGILFCNLFLYLVKGSGTANGRAVQSGANDLLDFVGAPIDYKFGEDGSTWVAINVTDGANSTCSHLSTGQHTLEVSSGEKRFLISLVGDIEANGKVITEHKFARVRDGQQVNVQVPEGSVAIVLTTQ
jgi:hypothetical protein